MIIRDKQFEAFAAAQALRFEDRAIAHLKAFWRDKCARLGEQSVRASIRLAVDRAHSYGLTSEQDIVRYLNYMYALGRRFDDDARYPWAKEVLSNPGIPPEIKMEWLSIRAKDELHGAGVKH